MRKFLYYIPLIFFLSCGTVKKRTTYGKERKVSVDATKKIGSTGNISEEKKKTSRASSKADNIISTALTYSGVRYKFGGTTKKGMDCSGLLYVSFGEHDIQLPRVSYQMAEEGRQIRVNNVEKGDLLFLGRANAKNESIMSVWS